MIDLSLGRINRLLARLDNPERRLPPVVHVAGTNGKGSVIAHLSAMLEAAGYDVHAFTSPHLIRFTERIRLAGRTITEDELASALLTCERANGEAPITYFEIATAAAFHAFAGRPADVLLLEVGLGGRLDATNVIERPLLTAITPVSMDHMHFLGETLTEIAGEKAGILKPGVAAVIGPQEPKAARAIAHRADKVGAPLVTWGEGWRAEAVAEGMVYHSGDGAVALPRPALEGRHQIDNAGMAIACLERMKGFTVGPDAMRRGLATVTWPGRLEALHGCALAGLLPPGAELWLDGGHNPGAGAALAATMAEWAGEDRAAGRARPLYLVVGMLKSKRPVPFLACLAPLVTAVLGIPIPGEAAGLDAAEITAAANEAGIVARPAADVAGALDTIADMAGAGSPPRVLICGSLYLAGRVLAGEGLGRITPTRATQAPAA